MAQDRSETSANRKATALVVALVGAVVYVWLAVSLAEWVLDLHWAVELVYFAVAGVAWAWPAAQLLRWVFAAPAVGRDGG